jgi:hypothetical protein
MAMAGCCKAPASDYWRGTRAPHVSTWGALGAAGWRVRQVGSIALRAT